MLRVGGQGLGHKVKALLEVARFEREQGAVEVGLKRMITLLLPNSAE